MGEINFVKISSVQSAAEYLTLTISRHLSKGEKVLWFITGGTSIQVASNTGVALKGTDLSGLSVTLTDERFVKPGSEDSNWKQLMNTGFELKKAKLYPVLKNKEQDIDETTSQYGLILKKLLDEADYRIGLFGMGPDGHIAALFPEFPQLNEDTLYATYLDNSPKPPPRRMTMTIPAINRLSEAVIFVMGDERKPVIEKLRQQLEVSEHPAQILKRLPKLTIFNDQIGGN